MTELREVSADELAPRVTKAISGSQAGKYAVGLFYQKGNLFYPYSVERGWYNTPTEAIKESLNPRQDVINPYGDENE